MAPTLPGCPTNWGVHSPGGHSLQPPSPLAGHECKKSFLALMAVKSEHKWNTLCRSILNCWVNAFKKCFLCCQFPMPWLPTFLVWKAKALFEKTFRVLEINKWGRIFALFSSSTKGQKPPHLEADAEREHRWVLFCVSSSTQSISWWGEGIWEDRMVKQL